MPPHISSTANPRIRAAVALRKPRQRRRTGLFLAEGPREVGRAVQAGLEVAELYTCPQIMDQLPPNLHAARHYTVDPAPFRRMCYRDEPEGVLAVVHQPRWDLAEAAAARPRLWLIAEGLTKPGNLGALARTALAAGANLLLVADGAVDAFNPNALRASTGACYHLPIFALSSEETVKCLRRHAVPLVAAVPEARLPYWAQDLRGDVAIAVGAEDRGLGPALRGVGKGAAIPMAATLVDSLNASVAAGILLFEAVRQRRSDGDGDHGP